MPLGTHVIGAGTALLGCRIQFVQKFSSLQSIRELEGFLGRHQRSRHTIGKVHGSKIGANYFRRMTTLESLEKDSLVNLFPLGETHNAEQID